MADEKDPGDSNEGQEEDFEVIDSSQEGPSAEADSEVVDASEPEGNEAAASAQDTSAVDEAPAEEPSKKQKKEEAAPSRGKKILKKGIGFSKWVALFAFIVFGGGFLGITYFLKKNPASQYKAKLESYVQRVSNDSFSVDSLEWRLDPASLSFKVDLKGARLEDYSTIKSARLAQASAQISLVRLLSLNLPVDVSVTGLEYDLSLDKEVNSGTENTRSFLFRDGGFQVPEWLSYLHYKIEAVDAKVRVFDGEELKYTIDEIGVLFSGKGLPGKFEGEFKAKPQVSLVEENVFVSGQTVARMSGRIVTTNGLLVGIDFESTELNLNDNLIIAGPIEKTPGYPLGIRGHLNVILSPERGYRKTEFFESSLWISNLQTELTAEHSFEEGLKAFWMLPRTRVQNFYLPIKYLRLLPFKGILETKMNFQKQGQDEPRVSWQMALNNLEADVSQVDGLFDNTSSGRVLLSAAVQGSMNDGTIDSPSIELVFNGTDADLHFERGQFKKAAGDKFEFLARAYVKDEEFVLQHLSGLVHTLRVKGEGKIGNFSRYLRGEDGLLDFSLITNRVNLRDWSSSFKFLVQSPPLEGFLELAMNLNGPINLEKGYDGLNWRFDKLTMSNVRGAFDPKEVAASGFLEQGAAFDGRFEVNVLGSARGVGSKVERASLNGVIDLTDMGYLQKSFKKEIGIPLRLDAKATMTPNELHFERGSLLFHTADLSFSGRLRQGQRGSQIRLRMNKPIELLHWRPFFPNTDLPLKGKIQWSGAVSIPEQTGFAKGIDWRSLALRGQLDLSKIEGTLPESGAQLLELSSKMTIGKGGVKISPSVYRSKDLSLRFSGQVKPQAIKGSYLPVSSILSDKAWDATLSIEMDRYNAQESGRPKQVGEKEQDRGRDLIEFLKNEYVKESRLNVDFSVKEGSTGDFSFSNLKGNLNWRNAQLVLKPFSLNALSGAISGESGIDARGFYLRNEDPKMSATLNAQRLDVNQLLRTVQKDMSKVLRGRLSAQMTLASEGILIDQLLRNSQGRVRGKLEDGYFESFVVLRDKIEESFRLKELRKLLIKEAQKEACIRESFVADLDAQISGGALKVSSSTVNFTQTDSHLNMAGSLDADAVADFKGDFFAGPRCIGGDVRKCLGGDGKAKVPFFIRGPASDAQASVDTTALTKKLQGCITTLAKNEIKERAEKELRENKKVQELRNQVQQKAEDAGRAATERLKKIFQGP